MTEQAVLGRALQRRSTQQSHRLPILPILYLGFVLRLALTFTSNGGGDLLNADMVKLGMLLQGQNPYLGTTYLSPYPSLYLLTLAGIILVPSIILQTQNFTLAVWTLRIALVLGHVLLAGLVYLYLKRSNKPETINLVIPATILFLPSFTIVGEIFFHGDIFGVLLLASSLLAYQSKKQATGNFLLALSASFKLQTILCLPILTIYQYKQGTLNARNTLSLYLPFLLLTIVPLAIVPGYYNTVVGFNLNNDNYWGYSILNLLRHVPASLIGFQVTNDTINQVWIPLALISFTLALTFTWKRSNNLQPAGLVVLGVGAWLLPLRQLQLHYMLWLIIPLLFTGKLRQTIPILAIFEVLNDYTAYLYTLNGGWNTLTNDLYYSSSLVLAQMLTTLIVGLSTIMILRTSHRVDIEIPRIVHHGVPILDSPH